MFTEFVGIKTPDPFIFPPGARPESLFYRDNVGIFCEAAIRDVLFSSGVRVTISRGIMNFLRVLISASLVIAARSKIS